MRLRGSRQARRNIPKDGDHAGDFIEVMLINEMRGRFERRQKFQVRGNRRAEVINLEQFRRRLDR